MIYAVIMGGGRGTRFWPESTAERPKQFLSLYGKKSMLRQTVDRIKKVISPKNILIVGNKSHYKLTCSELKDIPKNNIISEPMGRSTAPCLGLASIIIKKRDPDAVLVAIPADQIIKKNKQFLKIIKAAADVAQNSDNFITLGIEPKVPHTGYGYIEKGKKFIHKGGFDFYNISRFVEKPSVIKAKRYVKSRKYYWNSGMFVFHINTLLNAINEHMPLLFRGLCTIEKKLDTGAEQSTIKRIYGAIESTSIDYGIMEKVSNCLMVRADIGWCDVGSWSELDSIIKHNKYGNVIKGNCLALNSSNNIIHGRDKLIALLDVHDSVIVQTEKVVLVAKKKNVQHIKRIVEILENKRENNYL